MSARTKTHRRENGHSGWMDGYLDVLLDVWTDLGFESDAFEVVG